MQIQQYIQAKTAELKHSEMQVPEVRISGENYEVGGIPQLIASAVGWLRMFCFILLFASDTVFSAIFGPSKPNWAKDLNEWIK